MKKLLVLGVGNILLMDEGIGVHAIHQFWKEMDQNQWDETIVDFIDGGTFTQDIFYLFENYANLLVLDIVRAGHLPGSIYCLKEEDLRQNKKQHLSLHDIDLLDSLYMAEQMGNRPNLQVIGIEPAKIEWGIGLSDILNKSLPDFMEVARSHIRNILLS